MSKVYMCENIFRNQEERKRREDFTKLFVILANGKSQGTTTKQGKQG